MVPEGPVLVQPARPPHQHLGRLGPLLLLVLVQPARRRRGHPTAASPRDHWICHSTLTSRSTIWRPEVPLLQDRTVCVSNSGSLPR